jgi:hypothetical protein
MKGAFENVSFSNSSLDEFYFGLLFKKPQFAQLWEVIKLIHVLSHLLKVDLASMIICYLKIKTLPCECIEKHL